MVQNVCAAAECRDDALGEGSVSVLRPPRRSRVTDHKDSRSGCVEALSRVHGADMHLTTEPQVDVRHDYHRGGRLVGTQWESAIATALLRHRPACRLAHE